MYVCPRDECRRPSLLVFGVVTRRSETTVDHVVVRLPRATAKPIDGLEEAIQRDRLEAWSCFFGGDVRAAAIMARAALQRAVRALGGTGQNLAAELDALHQDHKITQDLATLGHEIRIAGNDAAHPDTLGEVAASEVRESLEFVDEFLTYTLAVPARVKRRIERRSQDAD
jgi:glutamate-1-semialdehyde aminotransferase